MHSKAPSFLTAEQSLTERIAAARETVERGMGTSQALLLLFQEAAHHLPASADIHALLAWQYYLESAYDNAIEAGLSAAEMYERCQDAGFRTLLYGILGTIYTRTGAYHHALRFYYKQRDVAQSLKDTHALANANLGLGIVYSEIGEHERALAYDRAALALFVQLEHIERVATVHMQMCHSFSQAGHDAEALKAGRDGLMLCDDEQLERIRGWLLYNMAIPLARLGKPRAGLRSALDALAIGRNRDDLLLTTLAHVAIGRCYRRLHDSQLAQQHFELALGLSNDLGIKRVAYEAHEELAQVCKVRGAVELALHHYEQYMALHRDLFGEQVVTQLRNQEILRQTKASQAEAEQTRTVNALLEERVAQRTSELEEALLRQRQLARDLQQAVKQQEQVNQLQSQIISTVSHAFRTPMTVIGASAELLEKFYERMTPTKRGVHFDHIRNAINDLTQMLSDTLWVNSVNTANIALNWERVAFGALCIELEQAVRQHVAQATNLHVHNSGDKHAEVRVDRMVVKQILCNLVSNAVKYGHEGVQIDVCLQLIDDAFQLSVVDDGAGIPPGEIDGLFQLFARGSNVESKRGLGIGLYTVRRLVETLGGTVSAESPGLNQGSCFQVTLPAEPTP